MTTVLTIGTGSRISPPKELVSKFVLGHISASDKNIFMKFIGYVGNGLQIRFLRKSNMAAGGRVPHIQHTGCHF